MGAVLPTHINYYNNQGNEGVLRYAHILYIMKKQAGSSLTVSFEPTVFFIEPVCAEAQILIVTVGERS